jgi:hypothetical protein
MGRAEPGALIKYKQKPLEGWLLEGLPLTPQALPARFTAYPTAAGLVGIGATLVSLLLVGKTLQGLGGPGSSRHLTPTTYHWENTSERSRKSSVTVPNGRETPWRCRNRTLTSTLLLNSTIFPP